MESIEREEDVVVFEGKKKAAGMSVVCDVLVVICFWHLPVGGHYLSTIKHIHTEQGKMIVAEKALKGDI